jgi:hypothetical protein
MKRKIVQLIPSNDLVAILKIKGIEVPRRVICLALIESGKEPVMSQVIWGVDMFKPDGSTLFFEENPDFVTYDVIK